MCLDLVKMFACFCMHGRMWWITFASSQRKGAELGGFLAALQLVEAGKLDRNSVREMHVTDARTHPGPDF